MENRKRQNQVTALALVIAFALAIAIIKSVFLGKVEKPEEFGLGKQSTAYFPRIDGSPIHVDSFSNFPAMRDYALKMAGNRKLTLWLGNSQLHGINQFTKGDVNCIEYMFREKDSSHFIVGYSLPNANLQEHYVVFKYVISVMPVKQLIIPVFFDDTRESGVRADLIRDPVKQVMQPDMDSSEFGTALRSQFETSLSTTEGENADMKALHSTTQENVEKKLNEKLGSVSEIWESRANIRSTFIYNYIYGLRNTVLGIDPSSKRKKIPARYDVNIEALRRTLALAKEKGIEVLVYIPPIRSDVEQPYFADEYGAFKIEVEQLCKGWGMKFYNAENVVPPEFWGTKPSTAMDKKAGEIDFMHFQAKGHKALVDSLSNKLN